jgi:hypothetical protein
MRDPVQPPEAVGHPYRRRDVTPPDWFLDACGQLSAALPDDWMDEGTESIDTITGVEAYRATWRLKWHADGWENHDTPSETELPRRAVLALGLFAENGCRIRLNFDQPASIMVSWKNE